MPYYKGSVKRLFSAVLSLLLSLTLVAEPLPHCFAASLNTIPAKPIARFSTEAMGFSGAAFRYAATPRGKAAMGTLVIAAFAALRQHHDHSSFLPLLMLGITPTDSHPEKRPAPTTIGLIGVGQFGRRILATLDALGRTKNFSTVAIARSNRLFVTGEFAASSNTQVPDIDAQGMLEDPNIKAVVIAVQAKQHFAIAKMALEADKHVLVEKPFTLTLADAQQLVNIAQARGLVLMVGHTLQYAPAFERLRDLVHEGALGEITSIEGQFLNAPREHRDRSSHVLEDLGTHELSMIGDLLRQDAPTEIGSVTTSESGETANVDLRYGAVPVHFVVSREHAQSDDRQLKIVGTKFTALYHHTTDPNWIEVQPTHNVDTKELETLRQRVASPNEEDRPLTVELSAFMDAVERQEQPRTNGESALSIVATIVQLLAKLHPSPPEKTFTRLPRSSAFLHTPGGPRIGVIGGGFFGSTAAWYLARAGFRVTLYEREQDIMRRSAQTNAGRLHLGFHYPRSLETVREARNAFNPFTAEYGDSLLPGAISVYAIAREGSKVSAAQYREFIAKAGLSVHEYPTELFFNPERVEMAVRGYEGQVNQAVLRNIVHDRLSLYGVNVQLGSEAKVADVRHDNDYVIHATYADMNRLLPPHRQRPLQFELMELVLLEMPDLFTNVSAVVMDGPFAAIGPWNGTGLHLLTHVAESIHHSNTGLTANVPPEWDALLRHGVLRNPKISKHRVIMEAAEHFFPALRLARYVGSSFALKTVLAHRDHDDARPTELERINENEFLIFPGKLSTAVTAAQQLVDLLATETMTQPMALLSDSSTTTLDWDSQRIMEWDEVAELIGEALGRMKVRIASYSEFLSNFGTYESVKLLERLIGFGPDRDKLFIDLLKLIGNPDWVHRLQEYESSRLPDALDPSLSKSLESFAAVENARELFLNLLKDPAVHEHLHKAMRFAQVQLESKSILFLMDGNNVLGVLGLLRPSLNRRVIEISLYDLSSIAINIIRDVMAPLGLILHQAGWLLFAGRPLSETPVAHPWRTVAPLSISHDFKLQPLNPPSEQNRIDFNLLYEEKSIGWGAIERDAAGRYDFQAGRIRSPQEVKRKALVALSDFIKRLNSDYAPRSIPSQDIASQSSDNALETLFETLGFRSPVIEMAHTIAQKVFGKDHEQFQTNVVLATMAAEVYSDADLIAALLLTKIPAKQTPAELFPFPIASRLYYFLDFFDPYKLNPTHVFEQVIGSTDLKRLLLTKSNVLRSNRASNFYATSQLFDIALPRLTVTLGSINGRAAVEIKGAEATRYLQIQETTPSNFGKAITRQFAPIVGLFLPFLLQGIPTLQTEFTLIQNHVLLDRSRLIARSA